MYLKLRLLLPMSFAGERLLLLHSHSKKKRNPWCSDILSPAFKIVCSSWTSLPSKILWFLAIYNYINAMYKRPWIEDLHQWRISSHYYNCYKSYSNFQATILVQYIKILIPNHECHWTAWTSTIYILKVIFTCILS